MLRVRQETMHVGNKSGNGITDGMKRMAISGMAEQAIGVIPDGQGLPIGEFLTKQLAKLESDSESLQPYLHFRGVKLSRI
jgi:hypothetical protein